MKKQIAIILILFIVAGQLKAQEDLTYLIHDTGDLKAAIYNDGSIGADHQSLEGPGVSWKDENGIYLGGPIWGTGERASVNGYLGSFQLNYDLNRVSSNFEDGFINNDHFDQITTATYNDNGAPNPYNVVVTQSSFSNQSDGFFYVRYTYENSNSMTLEDFYGGIFVDWDITDSFNTTNLGAYDTDRNLAYQFDTVSETSYYGVVAIDGFSGMACTLAGIVDSIRGESYQHIASGTTVPVITAGDYRSWIGSGPYDIPAGETVTVTFALVAGDDATGLLNNADAAIEKAATNNVFETEPIEKPEVSVNFEVDMSNEEVAATGAYFAASFLDWEPIPMQEAGNDLWRYTASLPVSDAFEFRYLNGNDWDKAENVPDDCQSPESDNRILVVPTTDTDVATVCFSGCDECEDLPPTSNEDLTSSENQSFTYPNPVQNQLFIQLPRLEETYHLQLFNVNGKSILSKIVDQNEVINVQGWPVGIYFLQLRNKGKYWTEKIIIK